jgi:hypothetical protein
MEFPCEDAEYDLDAVSRHLGHEETEQPVLRFLSRLKLEAVHASSDAWDALVRRLIRCGRGSRRPALLLAKIARKRAGFSSMVRQLAFLERGLPAFVHTFPVFLALVERPEPAIQVLASGHVGALLVGFLAESGVEALKEIADFFRTIEEVPAEFVREIATNGFLLNFLRTGLESQDGTGARESLQSVAKVARVCFVDCWCEVPRMIAPVIDSGTLRGACFRVLAVISQYPECKASIIGMGIDFGGAAEDADERLATQIATIKRNLGAKSRRRTED